MQIEDLENKPGTSSGVPGDSLNFAYLIQVIPQLTGSTRVA